MEGGAYFTSKSIDDAKCFSYATVKLSKILGMLPYGFDDQKTSHMREHNASLETWMYLKGKPS